MNDYRNLREILSNLADVQLSLVQKYLEKMDDLEFKSIPTILMTADAKKVIETYGCVTAIGRYNDNLTEPVVFHTIYCVFPSIFKIIT